MLIYTESFGHYAALGSSLATVNSQFDTGWSIDGGGGSVSIADGFDTDKSPLSRSVRLTRSASSRSRIYRSITSNQNIVIIGFEFRATGRGTVFSIPDVLDLEWPDKLSINGVTGNATIILNTVYHVEIKLNKSTRACEMRVNGYPYLTTTLPAGTTIGDTLELSFGWNDGPAPGNSVVMVSNISFVDSSPGKYTDFIGPKAMISYPPTESVEPVEWTPYPNNMSNVNIVSAIPANINRYTQSNVIGTKDYYKSNHTIDGEVAAIAVTSLVSKTDIDPQKVAIGISNGTTTKNGVDRDVEVQATYYQSVFETDADNNDWDATSAANVEFGVSIRPNA